MGADDADDRGAQVRPLGFGVARQVRRAALLCCECLRYGFRPAGFKLAGDVGSERGLIEVQFAGLFGR